MSRTPGPTCLGHRGTEPRSGATARHAADILQVPVDGACRAFTAVIAEGLPERSPSEAGIHAHRSIGTTRGFVHGPRVPLRGSEVTEDGPYQGDRPEAGSRGSLVRILGFSPGAEPGPQATHATGNRGARTLRLSAAGSGDDPGQAEQGREESPRCDRHGHDFTMLEQEVFGGGGHGGGLAFVSAPTIAVRGAVCDGAKWLTKHEGRPCRPPATPADGPAEACRSTRRRLRSTVGWRRAARRTHADPRRGRRRSPGRARTGGGFHNAIGPSAAEARSAKRGIRSALPEPARPRRHRGGAGRCRRPLTRPPARIGAAIRPRRRPRREWFRGLPPARRADRASP